MIKGPQQVFTYAENNSEQKAMRETFDTMNVVFPKDDFVINYDLTAGTEQGPYDTMYGLSFIGDKATIVSVYTLNIV